MTRLERIQSRLLVTSGQYAWMQTEPRSVLSPADTDWLIRRILEADELIQFADTRVVGRTDAEAEAEWSFRVLQWHGRLAAQEGA